MKPSVPERLPVWLTPATTGLAEYAELLATDGVTHGLIGPREVPRLWPRHLLNCAVVADPAAGLVPDAARVADVGSGAGLPGLVWALVRPDLRIVLVEPLLRRATFLTAAVERLALGERVEVVRGRAEEVTRQQDWSAVDVVTARAVAPLTRLLEWTTPLLRPGGALVMLKGASAASEVTDAAETARRLGITGLRVGTAGEGWVDPPTTVVLGTLRAQQ